VQGFQIDAQSASRAALLLPEDAGRALQKLGLPLRYLIGVNVKLLRQFG
jgi:hypothetical protein